MAACTLAVASFSCMAPGAMAMVDPCECRSCRIKSPVRCMTEWNSNVLTGHEDGRIYFWTANGEAVLQDDGSDSQRIVKMHNTAVTCLVAMGGDQGVWSCSSAGTVRKMNSSCIRTSIECKTPGKKAAHSTEVSVSGSSFWNHLRKSFAGRVRRGPALHWLIHMRRLTQQCLLDLHRRTLSGQVALCQFILRAP